MSAGGKAATILAAEAGDRSALLRLASQNVRDDAVAEIAPLPTHRQLAVHARTHRESVSREIESWTARALGTLSRADWSQSNWPRLCESSPRN